MLFSLLFFFANPTFADTKEDVELFMSHFISDEFWSPVRNRGRFEVTASLYANELQSHGVRVVDSARFRDMILPHTRQELIDQQEALVADTVLEYYGAAYLSDITDFFRTETGERMLLVAANEDIFVIGFGISGWSDKIDSWADYLSLQDLTHYSAFTSTPAGTFFVNTNQEATRVLLSPLRAHPNHFTPNLNQSFVLEILEADGVVEVSNRFAHQALLREIAAVLDQ